MLCCQDERKPQQGDPDWGVEKSDKNDGKVYIYALLTLRPARAVPAKPMPRRRAVEGSGTGATSEVENAISPMLAVL